MGLSDQERRSRIAYAIDLMVEKAEKLPDFRHHELGGRLVKQLCQQLWFEYTGHKGNAMHWLVGSGTDNAISSDASSLWSIALVGLFETARKEDSWLDESHQQRVAEYWALPPEEQLRKLNLEKERQEMQAVAIPALLRRMACADPHDGGLALIFEIYAASEELVYVLRRYQDELLKEFDGLHRLVARIQGACFSVFKKRSVYAHCYLLHQILGRNLLLKVPTPHRHLAIHFGWAGRIARRLEDPSTQPRSRRCWRGIDASRWARWWSRATTLSC